MQADEAFQKAKEYAITSNLIDNGLAETHLSLAQSSFWREWDFENTGISIKKAIGLSPGTSSIHGFNSLFLMASGKMEEAVIEANLAAKLLALKPTLTPSQAIALIERGADAHPDHPQILRINPRATIALLDD